MQILKPLANPAISRLWGGQSLSAIGDQLQRMALIWLSVELVGSDAGFVTALESAAVLATALLAGAFTERWDPRRTMIAADLARAGLAMAPVIAAALGHLSLWTLLPPALALAAFRVVFDPALQASLPRLTSEPRLLLSANALMDATARIARLVGPTLAGLLATVMPTVGLMALNAGTFVVSAGAVASLARELPPRRRPPAGSRLDLLLRGARAVRAQPLWTYLLWRGGVVNGLWTVAVWLCLPLAARDGSAGGTGANGLTVVGLVMAAYGAGNLASNLVVGGLRARRPVRMILWGNAVVGAGLMLMALVLLTAPRSHVTLLLMAASALTAVGGPISDIPMATLRQTAFPLHDVAAVYRLTIVFDWGGMLLATLVAPLLLRQAGPAILMLVCGAGVLGTMLAGLRRRDDLTVPAFADETAPAGTLIKNVPPGDAQA